MIRLNDKLFALQSPARFRRAFFLRRPVKRDE
jgi:hypothetical protein